jgi:ubiquinone biosynthesis protein COQ4
MHRSCIFFSKQFLEPYELTAIQRAFLVPHFAIGALSDPARGDYVAGLSDSLYLSQETLKRLKSKLCATSEGRLLLLEKPLINSETLHHLKLLSESVEDTLGKRYAHYMQSHNFSPDGRSIVKYMTDPDLAYIMARYRQVHDFWHVLCDLPATVLGEVALKWFEYFVTGLPITLVSGVFGPLRLKSASDMYKLNVKYIPWARRVGLECDHHRLLSFRYEQHLHCQVDDLRKLLKIEVAPKV